MNKQFYKNVTKFLLPDSWVLISVEKSFLITLYVTTNYVSMYILAEFSDPSSNIQTLKLLIPNPLGFKKAPDN